MVHFIVVKRWMIAIIIGIVVGGIGSGFYIWKTKYNRPVVSTTEQQSNTNSIPAKTLVWKDPTGFTFSYPEGLSVNPHLEDQENYAHVELTSSAHPGYIIVWAKDLPAGNVTLDAYIKFSKTYAGATIIDSMFTGQPAKKILLTTIPQQRHVVSYADDLLFVVEASLDDATFWSGAADGVVDSFAITSVQKDETTSDYAPADEEEIIL